MSFGLLRRSQFVAPETADTLAYSKLEALISPYGYKNDIPVSTLATPETENLVCQLGVNLKEITDEPMEIEPIEAETFDVIQNSPERPLSNGWIRAEGIAIGGLGALVSAGRLARRGASQTIDKVSDIYSLSGIYIDSAREKVASALTAPEHKTKRRLAGAAIGALALAGTTYLVYKGLAPNNHSQVHETAQQAIPSKAPAHHAEVLQPATPAKSPAGHPVAHHAAKAAAKAKQYKESLKYQGDTIWSHIQHRVQAHYHNLSQHKLAELTAKYTKQTLRLNHMSPAEARHMNVGDSFITPNQLG